MMMMMVMILECAIRGMKSLPLLLRLFFLYSSIHPYMYIDKAASRLWLSNQL